MRVILPGLLHACNCQIPRDRYLKVLYPGSTGAVSWLYNSGCYYTISESPVTRPSRALAEQHHAHYEDCYSEDEDNRSPPSLVSSVDSDSDDEFEPLFAKPDLTYPVDTIGAIHSALHPIMTRSSTEAELDAIVNYEHPLNDDQLPAISAAHNALPSDVIEAHLNE